MKNLPKFQLVHTRRIALIFAALLILMYWGGPYSINGSVARLYFDRLPVSLSGGNPGLVVSGHRFACDRQLSPFRKMNQQMRNRCTTHIAGKLLDLEFQIEPFKVHDCQLKYGDRAMKCNGFQDYKNRTGQADFWLDTPLALTEIDRFWILINNPLANIFGNISELDWNTLDKILAWVISSLLGLGLWLDFRKASASLAILLSLIPLFLNPLTHWLVLLSIIVTGHVD